MENLKAKVQRIKHEKVNKTSFEFDITSIKSRLDKLDGLGAADQDTCQDKRLERCEHQMIETAKEYYKFKGF